jgi:hypothetical protein
VVKTVMSARNLLKKSETHLGRADGAASLPAHACLVDDGEVDALLLKVKKNEPNYET